MTVTPIAPARAKARIDQWLWFARFVKSRSLAARLCAAGTVALNGTAVRKPGQNIQVGDVIVLPQGGWQRTVRVLDLGVRRGPAPEAQQLYEETAAALRLRDLQPAWAPLLTDDMAADEFPPAGPP